jgi:hypothetical protein
LGARDLFLSYEELVPEEPWKIINPEEPWEIIFNFINKNMIIFDADGAAQVSVWALLSAT